MIRIRSILAIAATATAVGLAVAIPGGTAAPGGAAASRAFDSKCGQFPAAAGVAADAPSLPDQRAWNQDISGAPVAPRLGPDHRLHQLSRRIPSCIRISARPKIYGIPFEVVGRADEAGQGQVHRLRRRVRQGQVPDPALGAGRGRPEGRRRPPRASPTTGRAACSTSSTAPSPSARRWNADGGAIWDLRRAGLRTERVHLRRRRRAADLPRPRPLRRGRRGRDRPRDPGHVRVDPRRLDPSGLPLRRRHRGRATPRRWACGCGSRPPTTLGGFSGAVGGDRRGAQALRDDHRRQRVQLVLPGAPDRRWNDNNLNQLKAIPGSAFEVVRSEAEVETC